MHPVAVPHPDVPPLRPPAHQVSPRAIRWWQLRALLLLVLVVGAQLPLLIALGLPGWLIAITVTSGGLVLLWGLLVPPILFRIHRWEVTDEAVYTMSGWFVREWRIAPISRVQTVDTQNGPLQQLLTLASVTVTTASARGAVKITGLDARDAAELARMLTATTQATPGDAT